MIARAAESNPSAFSPTPLVDIEETLVPAYLRLVRHFSSPLRLPELSIGETRQKPLFTHKVLRDGVQISFKKVSQVAPS